MYPELVSIGPFTVHSFGLMMALGFVVAGAVVYYEFRRQGMNPENVYWLTLAAAVGGLLGSKIHYLLLHLNELKGDPLSSAFSGAGLVWYGGFIGGLLAGILVGLLFRLDLARALDACAPGMAIGYAFGRVGCFLNGDDYGIPSTLPWAMGFPEGAPPTPAGLTVQPTQLYEAISGVVIFLVLWYLRPRLKGKGSIFLVFLVLAGLERFLVEFVRAQRPGQVQQQVLALGMAAIAVVALVIMRQRARNLG
ncbi:MAG: prolipoprotein diacylglyceryl transferase [Thermoleophilia bacterium]